jgi:aminopeptidase 2
MGATEYPVLVAETLEYTLTKARDQDVRYLFIGLQANFKTRRILTRFFEDNFEAVST